MVNKLCTTKFSLVKKVIYCFASRCGFVTTTTKTTTTPISLSLYDDLDWEAGSSSCHLELDEDPLSSNLLTRYDRVVQASQPSGQSIVKLT